MTFKDTVKLSWGNITGNRLRTVITVIIIALGIFALILIITAIQAASNSLTDSFSTMGANAFSVRFKDKNIRFGGGAQRTIIKTNKSALKQKNSSIGKIITYEQAKEFKERYPFPAKVGLAIRGAGGIVVNNENKKTNPDINVTGGDENYLELNGYKIAYGRNITAADVESGSNVCILGNDVAEKLYPGNAAKAVDKVISVDHIPYRVLAVLDDKGSSAFLSTGKVVITSYNNIRRLYATQNSSFAIAVMVPDINLMDAAIGEARGAFRPIRKLDIKEEDNFYIDKSDSIAEKFLSASQYLQYAMIAIALITLIGAAIGLMNIMLVAVNERTKEIGLIKALGGTKKDIRDQFLWESVLISLMGAIAGIIAGVLIGNVVAILLKTGFVIPWAWVIAGIFVCSLVGLVAGLYPAIKASKLNPIDALRYE
ncbi:ABC transporter permease [Ferruginibacter sp. SUN106]|uniref:ABC transporter permease n=1 Tax=Ferruginibacter sp. SUN106 TaxID=2978348 RepID=UPI003D36F796